MVREIPVRVADAGTRRRGARLRHRHRRGAGSIEGRISGRRQDRIRPRGSGRLRESRRACSRNWTTPRSAPSSIKSEAAKRQAAANLMKVQAQLKRAEATYQQKKSVNRAASDAGRPRIGLAGGGRRCADLPRKSHTATSTVVEADAAIAAVLQDDAAAQHRLDGVVESQHELRAPFDARVIARHKELGSIVNAGEAGVHVDRAGLDLGAGLCRSRRWQVVWRSARRAFVRLRSEADRLVETEVVRIDQENDRVTEERRVYVRCRACSSQHQLRFLGRAGGS